jgi:hypothetical protein
MRDTMKRLLVPSLLVLGLLFLGLGWQWNRIRPPTSYWSDEKAAEYTAAHVALHSLAHAVNGNQQQQDAHAKEFAAAKERFLKIDGELERAQNSRDYTKTILSGIGIVCVLSGVVAHVAERVKTA